MTTLNRTLLDATALTLFCISSIATSNAEIIIHDTTGFANSFRFLVGLSSGSNKINQPADSFVVSGGSYWLESITLELTSSSRQSGGTPGNYEIRIWNTDVDKPGNILESMTLLESDSLSGDSTVYSVSKPLLSDGNTYWISAALPDNQSRGLLRTARTATNGQALAFSGNADPEWIASGATQAFRLKITGILVPEPSSIALAGLSLLGVAIGRRR